MALISKYVVMLCILLKTINWCVICNFYPKRGFNEDWDTTSLLFQQHPSIRFNHARWYPIA